MPSFPIDPDEETLRNVVEALTESGQAVSIYDAEDNLRYANETYRGMFLVGYEGPYTFPDILRYGAAHGLGVRIDDGDVEALIARTLPRRRTSRRKSFETDLVDGRWFWIEHTVLPNGWVMTVGTDISALKHNEKSLRQAHESALLASRTDLLTGLPNRRYILELLDEGLTAGGASGAGLCAAIIDIDQFKVVNDTYGHEAGDAVLRHFAQVFRESLRSGDHLGRIGGEEFLLLQPDVRLDDATRLINRIRAEFPPATLPDQATRRPIAFSAGLTAALPYDDRGSILSRADRALYAAKAEGRNCTRIGLGMERTATDRAHAPAKTAGRSS
ncbi:diguanylate cyclase [Microvirga sp. BT688]|uniref:GGDEF domain-containing protein n=1 Tax=Microvirga sp. TaxID=1873136 RepID=UPI001687AE18|nr:sensor domain-containing diguanylate cyclase [Microvirga sp.]MBD2746091.1 diguanylate cyclase [Microvirga sp.]